MPDEPNPEEPYEGRYTCRSCSEPTDNDSDVCDACQQEATDGTRWLRAKASGVRVVEG